MSRFHHPLSVAPGNGGRAPAGLTHKRAMASAAHSQLAVHGQGLALHADCASSRQLWCPLGEKGGLTGATRAGDLKLCTVAVNIQKRIHSLRKGQKLSYMIQYQNIDTMFIHITNLWHCTEKKYSLLYITGHMVKPHKFLPFCVK